MPTRLLQILLPCFLAVMSSCSSPRGGAAEQEASQVQTRPNIIFILADDLGYGDLGSYGQQAIQTPHLDRLAREGMRFTQAYSGAPVCAPARSVLMTGQHTGHTYVRGNFSNEGQRVSFPAETVTVAEVLQGAGYTTGLFGKWGLGAANTSGIPTRQGFDAFYGYLDQRDAHEYYPDSVWVNEEKVLLAKSNLTGKNAYAADWYFDKLKDFVRQNQQGPFFAYFASQLPHNKFQLPVAEQYANQDWPEGQKVYATMVSHLDRQVGELQDLLQELGLADNTLLVFTSDNGPATLKAAPGDLAVEASFFNSAGGLRGIKRELYEGGIRVPMIVKWPGQVPAGAESDYPWAFWDVLPTLAEVAGAEVEHQVDGLSVLPVLRGQPGPERDYLYWEFHLEGKEQDLNQALRSGDWKVVQNGQAAQVELYNLAQDRAEQQDLATRHPEKVTELTAKMQAARSASPYWQ